VGWPTVWFRRSTWLASSCLMLAHSSLAHYSGTFANWSCCSRILILFCSFSILTMRSSPSLCLWNTYTNYHAVPRAVTHIEVFHIWPFRFQLLDICWESSITII
jgi:hypothetical protein